MPTWKGADKPGGSRFVGGVYLTTLEDCPKCKYGTMDRVNKKKIKGRKCADCGHFIPDPKD